MTFAYYLLSDEPSEYLARYFRPLLFRLGTRRHRPGGPRGTSPPCPPCHVSEDHMEDEHPCTRLHCHGNHPRLDQLVGQEDLGGLRQLQHQGHQDHHQVLRHLQGETHRRGERLLQGQNLDEEDDDQRGLFQLADIDDDTCVEHRIPHRIGLFVERQVPRSLLNARSRRFLRKAESLGVVQRWNDDRHLERHDRLRVRFQDTQRPEGTILHLARPYRTQSGQLRHQHRKATRHRRLHRDGNPHLRTDGGPRATRPSFRRSCVQQPARFVQGPHGLQRRLPLPRDSRGQRLLSERDGHRLRQRRFLHLLQPRIHVRLRIQTHRQPEVECVGCLHLRRWWFEHARRMQRSHGRRRVRPEKQPHRWR